MFFFFLTDDLRDFVRQKVESGEFPSEEAVLREAVRRFRQDGQDGRGSEEPPTPDDLIDQFVCADQRLCDIALLEGLAVVNPERP
jgi:Arc/MetJ-type ribon-helix-helix transcriptional regulator